MKTLALCGTLLILATAVLGKPNSWMHERVRRQAATCSAQIPFCNTCTNPPLQCKACPSRYVMSTDKKACIECPSNCNTCKEITGKTDIGECTSCDSGYFLKSGTCVKCASSCKDCSGKGEGKCDDGQCMTGYTWDKNDFICKACGSNCLKCDTVDLGGCDPKECDTGFTTTSIVAGQAVDSIICSKCSEFCSVCDTLGPGKCDSADKCAAKTVYTADQTCKACGSFCLECSACVATDTTCPASGVKCTKCDAKYGIQASTFTCQSCPQNCKLCGQNAEVCDDGQCIDGFYKDGGGKCSACITGCKVCSVSDPTKCTECYPGYISIASVCQTCNGNCLTCGVDPNDANLKLCTKCPALYTATNQATCDECPSNCNTCEVDANSNVRCKNSGCSSGYAYRASDGTCQECPSNCHTCTWDTNKLKTSCSIGSCTSRYTDRQTDGQCHKCPDRCSLCGNDATNSQTVCTFNYCDARSTYDLSSMTCPACPANCEVCNNIKGLQCTKCDANYAVSTDGASCKPCPSNCVKCEVDALTQATKCLQTQCSSGYYIDSSFACVGCAISNCAVCDSTGACSKCADNTAVMYSDTENTIISSCSTCQSCQAGKCVVENSAVKCTGCIDRYVLDNSGQCQPCPSGCDQCSYDTGFTVKTCTSCIAEGYTKMDKDICVACPRGASSCSLSGNIMTILGCTTGYVNNGGNCHKCPANCNACSFSTLLGRTQCSVGSCATGYVLNSNNFQCDKCASDCQSCTTAGTCAVCNSDKILSGTICKSCPGNCLSCTIAGEKSCDNCKPGYVKTAKVINGITSTTEHECKKCSDKCKSCTSLGAAKCDNNQCEDGYTNNGDNSQCSQCPNGCKNCNLNNGQVRCIQGKCHEGYTMDSNFVCQKCPTGCAACKMDESTGTPVMTCVACLTNGKGKSYVMDTAGNCVDCPAFCTTCKYENGKAVCDNDGCDPKFAQGTSGTSCSGCTGSCKSCTLPSTCDANQCEAGYYSTASGSSFGCTACVGGCATCIGNTACVTCPLGQALNSTSSECIACETGCTTCSTGDPPVCGTCDSLYYKDSNSICQPCGSDCLACDANGCLANQCNTSFAIDTNNNGACAACPENCNACDSSGDPRHGLCTECASGYRITTTAGNTTACEACTVTYCLVCTSSASTCDTTELSCGATKVSNTSDCLSCSSNCDKCDSADTCKLEGCAAGYGYDSTASTSADYCRLCDTNCKKCDGQTSAGKCNTNECNVGYAYDATDKTCKKVRCTASDADAGLNVVAAGTSCLTKATGCLVAVSSSATSDNAYCPEGYCDTGYVWANDACTPCPGSCATCYMVGSTATCLKSGCYQKYAIKSDGTCTPCPTGCDECSYSGSTLVCNSLKCSAGFNAVSAGTCMQCNSNCLTCKLSTASNIIDCNDCKPSYTKHSGTQTCFACSQSCSICSLDEVTSSTECSTCLNEFALDENKACQQCPSGCLECTAVPNSLTGQTTCKPNMCYNRYGQDPTAFTCRGCPTGCSSCEKVQGTTDTYSCFQGKCDSNFVYYTTGTNVGQCDQCTSDCKKCNFATKSQCLGEQCGLGFGIQGTTCKACDEGCNKCTITGNTQPCQTSQCKSRYVWSATDGGKCIKCPDFCQECTVNSNDESKCNTGKCDAGYALDTTKACQKCPTKSISCTWDSVASTLKVVLCEARYVKKSDSTGCEACGGNCKDCTSSSTCTSCDDKYVLDSGTCKACASNCLSCSVANECTVCASGFAVTTSNKCEACTANCLQCDKPNECNDGKCAPRFTYDSSTKTCIACTEKCASCSMVTGSATPSCDVCDLYYTLLTNGNLKSCTACPRYCQLCTADVTGKVLCDTCYSGYTKNDKQCGNCPLNCLECSENSGSITCSKCMDGFAPYDGLCYSCGANCDKCIAEDVNKVTCESCKVGYNLDSTGLCKKCTELAFASCATCDKVDATGKSKCLTCEAGTTMKEDGSACLSCSSEGIQRCNVCEDVPNACTGCETGSTWNPVTSTCQRQCHTCNKTSSCPDWSDTKKFDAAVSNGDFKAVTCDGPCMFNKDGGTIWYECGMVNDTCQADQTKCVKKDTTCSACCSGDLCNPSDSSSVLMMNTLLTLILLLSAFYFK